MLPANVHPKLGRIVATTMHAGAHAQSAGHKWEAPGGIAAPGNGSLLGGAGFRSRRDGAGTGAFRVMYMCDGCLAVFSAARRERLSEGFPGRFVVF